MSSVGTFLDADLRLTVKGRTWYTATLLRILDRRLPLPAILRLLFENVEVHLHERYSRDWRKILPRKPALPGIAALPQSQYRIDVDVIFICERTGGKSGAAISNSSTFSYEL
jgi:hypothetical protein